MNELLLIVEIIVIFSMVVLSNKLFGKYGLITWVAIASIIANIEVIKSVDVFGIATTLGNVMFASTFLATDILSECYGKKEAKNAVYIGLASVVVYIICTQITLAYNPSSTDIAQNSMQFLFGLAPRVCISSLTMYFIANLIDVYLFDKLKEKTKERKLWLRNNISTIICNCSENFGFTFLAFFGVYDISTLLTIAFSTSIIEMIIALCDTPFLYLAKHLHLKKEGKKCFLRKIKK